MSDSIGFPQLDFATYPSQVFWLVITFTLMYFMMSNVVLPPIKELIDNRHAKRKTDLDKAEKCSDETQKIREDYETALESARIMAAQTLISTEKKIKKDNEISREVFTSRLENELNEAEIRINEVKEKALTSVGDMSAEIAKEMIYRVANININPKETKKVVDNIMNKGTD